MRLPGVYNSLFCNFPRRETWSRLVKLQLKLEGQLHAAEGPLDSPWQLKILLILAKVFITTFCETFTPSRYKRNCIRTKFKWPWTSPKVIEYDATPGIQRERNKMQTKTANFAPLPNFAPLAATWRSPLNNVVCRPTVAATWQFGRNLRVIFDSGLFPTLYENMTSCTKPEIHNVWQCRQRKTDSRPQVTCSENLVKFGCVVFELCEQRDKQTDIQTRWPQYFAPTGAKQKMYEQSGLLWYCIRYGQRLLEFYLFKF